MPALQMDELRQEIGLISTFLKVTLVHRNGPLRAPAPTSPISPHSQVAPLKRARSAPARKCARALRHLNTLRAVPGGQGCRGPPCPEKAAAAAQPPPFRPPGERPRGSKEPGRWPRDAGETRDSLTVTLGPDKQRHALQALHVAGRHMSGAPVVPLPVLVEGVNLHPTPGVGHLAAWGPGPAGVAREGGPGKAGARPRAEGPSASLQLLAAPEPRCRTHGPPRGRVLVPAFPRLWLLGAIVQARGALPPQSGRAALRSFPPRRARNSGRRSLPCSRLRHDLSKAASRAAAASSSRRRHVFLPYTWPCHRSRRLCSSRLLQMSEADGRQVPLQLLPLRGRLRELPSARALLDTESPYPSAAATASSVFLTEPKPPPSWFAPQ